MKSYSSPRPVRVIALFILGASLALLSFPPYVSALNDSPSADIDVQSNCVGYVDGTTQTYTDVDPNTTLSLTVTNDDGVVSQDVSGNGFSTTLVQPDTKTTNNVSTINFQSGTSQNLITFTPLQSSNPGTVSPNYCPLSGSTPTPSTLLINPIDVTLACSLSGTIWSLNGNLVGSSNGTGLFDGSTKLTNIGVGSFGYTMAASTTAETVTAIDGLNFSGKGTDVASATCPGYQPPAQTTTAKSSTTQPTATSATTTPTATTVTTTPSATATTTTLAPQAVAVSNTPHSSPKTINPKHDSYILPVTSGAIVVVIVLGLLVAKGIIPLNLHLMDRLKFHKKP